jgi:hypothetical protein
MKTRIASLLLALVTFAATAADPAVPTDWAGKIVAIKTTNGGSSCIRIQNYVVTVGQPDKNAPDASLFKMVPGTGPGTYAFESVANPGMYLRHGSLHILLHKDIIDESSYRVLPPLRGNQGVSLQSYNYPGYHITVIDKDHVDIVETVKEPHKAIFYLEERKK